MIKGCLAVGILGHVFSGDDGHIHHAAAAGLSVQRGLLGAVPDAAIMDGQVTGLDIKADLAGVGVIVDEVFFAEQEAEHALFMCSRQYPETAILKRGIVQVDAHV